MRPKHNPVLEDTSRSHSFYHERWVYDSVTGHIKLFANPRRCLTRRGTALVIWDCSERDCVTCPDRWGNKKALVHTKLGQVSQVVVGLDKYNNWNI